MTDTPDTASLAAQPAIPRSDKIGSRPQRILKRYPPLILLAALWLLGMFTVAALAPIISPYDYTAIDLWIDGKLYLPTKIVAFTSQEDVYKIKFAAPKVNETLKENVFDFQIPAGFDKPEIIPLEKKKSTK